MTHTTTEAGPATRSSPFQGLTHFRSNDERYFFGRETEREILKANLIVSRLTIVYGPSGVGKSSLLGAGVQHDLLEESQSAIAAGRRPEHLIVLHAGPWHRDAVRALDDAIRAAAGDVHGAEPPAPGSVPLDELLRWWADHLQARLLIVLDQFEEYLLYAETTAGLRLDRELPSAVTRTDIDADFMISIREDALAGLDRFKTRIPNLFETRVRIDHLDRQAATRAIREPIDRWNEDFRAGLPPITVEDDLVETLLDQVRTGHVVVGTQGRGTGKETGRIETPHLQLVMEKLWEAENLDVAEPVLRRATLERLGGARQIVVTRGREAIDNLPPDDQRVVAAIFDRLVTPSGAKIAHALEDLAKWAKVEPAALRPILDKLCAGDLRILRPIAPAPGAAGGPRYELFHDVLAGAILDWQARYEHEQEQQRLTRRLAAAADERRRAEEQTKREQENARRADENARAAAEYARRAEESASRARRLSIVALATAGIALSLLVAGVVLWQKTRQQAATARSLALVSSSDEQRAMNPELSLLLSLEAYRSEHSTDAVSSMILALDAAESPGAVRYLHGHGSAVNDMALDRDGGMLASTGDDGTIRLWDVAGGRQLGEPLLGHKGPVRDVAFSPDGQRVASAGSDGAIFLWDTRSRKQCKLSRDRGVVQGVAFSRDGRMLASADAEGLSLWDLPRTCGTHRARPLGGKRDVNGVSFSPDGRTLAAANGNGTIELWDLRTPAKPLRVLRGHVGHVQSIVFGPYGRSLASAGDDGTIRIWDVRGGKSVIRNVAGDTRRVGPSNAVYTVAFSRDGRTLASGDNSGKVRLWSVPGLEPRGPRLTGHPRQVHSVTFGRDGRTLFSAGTDGTIRVWELRPHAISSRSFHRHDRNVWSVAFSPRDDTYASAANDGTIRFWHLRKARQPEPSLRNGVGASYSVSYGPDGDTIAAGGANGIRMWDVHTHHQVGATVPSHNGGVQSVVFSPDGRTLASAGELTSDGERAKFATISFWDGRGRSESPGHEIQIPQKPEDDTCFPSLAFSQDESTLASAVGDWTVRLWDVHDPTRITPVGQMDHASEVCSVAFSPDGRTIASSSADGSIRLWDAHTQAFVAEPLIGGFGKAAVRSLAFSPDGRMFASAGDDGTIRLWDAASGRQVGELGLGGQERSAASVAFSPEGRLFASAGQDGTVRIWGWLDDEELHDRVCGLVGTGLSPDEWDRLVPDLSYHRSCP